MGVEVDVHTDTKINLKKYDIVHIFNTIRVQESFQYLKHAKQWGKRIVVTPIYWDLSLYYQQFNFTHKLSEWNHANKKRQLIFDYCDVFLPHCKTDEALIIKNYGNHHKSIIIPYGVNKEFLEGKGHRINKKYNIKDYALCVARIGKQKNQLNLIKSILNEDITLILTGQINDHEYLKDCLRLKYSKLMIIEKLTHKELLDLYKGARVHILPSWYEYPGLVNLEAGLSGCNVVTTSIGTTKEVFKEFVWYCDPNNIKSIHNTLMNAFETKKKNEFQEYILENYSWANAGMKVIEVYNSLLK